MPRRCMNPARMVSRIAGREVDIEVVPFRGRELRDPALHQCLAGRDQLDDGRPPGIEIGLDGADQRGTLHPGQEMAEELLLGALEGGERRRLGVPVQRVLALDDAGRLQCLLDILVDHLEGAGIGVLDAPLLRGERVFENGGDRPARSDGERESAQWNLPNGAGVAQAELHECGIRNDGTDAKMTAFLGHSAPRSVGGQPLPSSLFRWAVGRDFQKAGRVPPSHPGWVHAPRPRGTPLAECAFALQRCSARSHQGRSCPMPANAPMVIRFKSVGLPKTGRGSRGIQVKKMGCRHGRLGSAYLTILDA